MELGLAKKVALVTGASKGIGRAIVEEFAKEGAFVSMCARSMGELLNFAEEVGKYGVAVQAIRANVTKLRDIRRVVEETVNKFGQLHILVNNAGDAWMGRSFETSDEEWRYCMDVNLYSAVRFTRYAVPYMLDAGWGRIINISSVSGHTMTSGMVDYQTAKAAMIAFSKSMSLDLAPFNILVNCVCPALIRTALWERLADSFIPSLGTDKEEVLKNIADNVLSIKRFGSAEEVAALVAFLASERASFVTGAAYDVDGGATKSIF